MADKLIVELQKIGEYTGISIESLYEMLENQANVHLIYDILGFIGCISLLSLGIFAILYFRKKDKEDYNYSTNYESLMIASSVATTIIAGASLVIIPLCVGEIIQILINKPAWILEYLTGLIK